MRTGKDEMRCTSSTVRQKGAFYIVPVYQAQAMSILGHHGNSGNEYHSHPVRVASPGDICACQDGCLEDTEDKCESEAVLDF